MRRILGFLPLALMLAAVPAFGAEMPYDAATYQKLLASGQPVAVDIYATWCPTCRAQAPLVKSITAEPQFKSLTVLLANFDTEKALCKSLNVSEQSTLVVFRNGKEVARSTGDTTKAGLTHLLLAAIR